MKRVILTLAFLITALSLPSESFAYTRIRLSHQVHNARSMSAAGNLVYYGGPVVSSTKVITVFWGPAIDPAVKSKISGFYKTIVNSSYFDWLKEYNTTLNSQSGQKGTNQKIGRGTFGGEFTITPSFTANVIDDSNIRAEITAQIQAKNLPAADDNSLYMIHFPKGSSITLPNGGSVATSCQDFCAYHNNFHMPDKQTVLYGVMPDLTDGICPQGCGTNDTFGNTCAAASHEVVEATTDALIGDVVGTTPIAPLAWYDPSQGEIGDICAGTQGNVIAADGTSYIVQGQWSNAQNACVTSPKN